MPLRYDIVDVFTDRPFAGNQLAVVHGADELSAPSSARRSPASSGSPSRRSRRRRSTGGSEYATRIFTPEQEIPFAGPPDARARRGCCGRTGLLTADDATQVCGAGRIGVRFDGDRVELTADAPRPGGPGAARRGPRAAAAARPVPVRRGRRDLGGRLRPELRARPGDRGGGGAGVRDRRGVPARSPTGWPGSATVRGPAGRGEPVRRRGRRAPHLDVHARVFVPGAGVPEDPATGSAAAGLGVALVATGLLPEGGTLRDHARASRWAVPRRSSGRVEATGRRGDALPRRRRGAAGGVRRDRGAARSAELRAALDPPVQHPGQRDRGWSPASAPGHRAVGVVGQSRRAPRRTRRSARSGARCWSGPPVGGRGQVGGVQPAGHQRRGHRPPLLRPRAYDGRGAGPGDQPAAVVLAAQHAPRPGRRPRCRGAAARRRRRPRTARRRATRATPACVVSGVPDPATPVFFASSATRALSRARPGSVTRRACQNPGPGQ